MEYVITSVIIILVIFIICKSIKTSAKGECNCSNCNAKCSKRKKEAK